VSAAAGSTPRYKMGDLCALTGLPRQVIHFYIHEGLLPEGRKTGKTMAYYGPEHLERIRLIKKLQDERFLPLKAIKALFDAELDAFTPEQRTHLSAVASRVQGDIGRASTGAPVDARALAGDHGLHARDIDGLAEIGILRVHRDADGAQTIDPRDAELVSLFGQFRRAGFTEDLGFEARDLAFYVEATALMLRRETELIAKRATLLSPDRLARMLEDGLPIVHAILARHHENAVRDLVAALAEPQAAGKTP
jgi:DNA-binding transcriptional MerR regulator